MVSTARTYTLDLHGLKVHQAQSLLQETIDKCSYHGYTSLKVIFGHGTGKLAEMCVSEYLANPLVDSQGVYLSTEHGYMIIPLN